MCWNWVKLGSSDISSLALKVLYLFAFLLPDQTHWFVAYSGTAVRMEKEQIHLLKNFVLLCQADPGVLHRPELAFYKQYLESWVAVDTLEPTSDKLLKDDGNDLMFLFQTQYLVTFTLTFLWRMMTCCVNLYLTCESYLNQERKVIFIDVAVKYV